MLGAHKGFQAIHLHFQLSCLFTSFLTHCKKYWLVFHCLPDDLFLFLKMWLTEKNILPPFTFFCHVIWNACSMPSVWNMVNFNKIHPSLFAKMKLFYLIQFFVKGYTISATPRSKKVFFSSNLLWNWLKNDLKVLPAQWRA